MKVYALGDLNGVLAHVARTRTVVGPVTVDGEVHLMPMGPFEWANLGGPLPKPLFSAKQLFFAEREPLFVFEGGRFVERLPVVSPVAALLSACDLAAVAYQSRFFADDPYYQARRRATLLIGIDCIAPCEEGFCHAMDTGPAVRKGMADLIVHEGPRGSFLIAATAAGEAALTGLSLELAGGQAMAHRAASQAEVARQLGDMAHVERGISRLNAGEVAAETWEELGERCVTCSGCTTVCPTCSCFATRDEVGASSRMADQDDANATDNADPGDREGGAAATASFTRVRFWDSCLFEGFQKEASGHNPAPTNGMRLERFYYHKLSRDFEGAAGRLGCVGCGRCEIVCPGVVGIHATLRRLADA